MSNSKARKVGITLAVTGAVIAGAIIAPAVQEGVDSANGVDWEQIGRDNAGWFLLAAVAVTLAVLLVRTHHVSQPPKPPADDTRGPGS